MEGLLWCSDVLEPRYGMDLLSDWQHYHRVNVILLSAIGLWPYGNKFVLRLKQIVAGFFTLCSCFCQLATFVTVDYTMELLLKNAPSIFVGCGVSFKYISFLIASDSIKKLMESINGDWKDLSCKEEIRIIAKYVESGKFHTKGFAMFICPMVASLVFLQLSPIFYDIVIPLNQARSHNLPIMLELFFDQKKYCFLAACIFDGAVIFALFVLVSTETLIIVYGMHICALFEVTSHRIKNLLCASAIRDSKSNNNGVMIGQVVRMHCRAVRHCRSLREDFLPFYLIYLVFGILGLAAHLFRCTQTFTSHEFVEFVTSGMFCFGIFGYMFYLNSISQNLIDWSLDIFDDLYNTEWYKFPASTRKLLLFCMLNCSKSVAMDVCSIFTPSYEGFSLIVRMAMTYATAIYSFQ